jgi:hypothetical protein
MLLLILPTAKAKLCRCGSRTHLRTNHRLCPMNSNITGGSAADLGTTVVQPTAEVMGEAADVVMVGAGAVVPQAGDVAMVGVEAVVPQQVGGGVVVESNSDQSLLTQPIE